jgi:hypothetical protein
MYAGKHFAGERQMSSSDEWKWNVLLAMHASAS